MLVSVAVFRNANSLTRESTVTVVIKMDITVFEYPQGITLFAKLRQQYFSPRLPVLVPAANNVTIPPSCNF
jgi:hypothetical protein